MNKQKINNDGAIMLLEAILRDSGDAIRSAIPDYLEASRKEEEIKKTAKKVLKELHEVAVRKADAESTIRRECGFLMGKSVIKPPIDGQAVAVALVLEALNEADEDTAKACVKAAEKKVKAKGKKK